MDQKNISKILEQARSWAELACELAGLRQGKLDSWRAVCRARKRSIALYAAAEARYEALRARVQRVGGDLETPEDALRRAGAHLALGGLMYLWDAARKRGAHKKAMRIGFEACAAGLASVFVASNGRKARLPAQHLARAGAGELFDELTRNETEEKGSDL